MSAEHERGSAGADGEARDGLGDSPRGIWFGGYASPQHGRVAAAIGALYARATAKRLSEEAGG
jgi:hypothetical protein